LAQADAVISATGAPHLILHAHHLKEAMTRRNGRELLLIDLAVPRDIDPATSEIPGIVLCDVDGLQQVVDENITLRNDEREQVEMIVEEALDEWIAEQATRRVAPTIVRLRRSAEEIRQAELAKALNRLAHLGEEERAVVEALSRGLMNKFLHEPTVRLREKAGSATGDSFQQTVEELFGLEERST
ncbi:MAG: glutamyl-tRNA reductase, partial [Ardenticatenaceae bacterium]